mmetsp:Transcript_108691/g.306306  ORF Transcript_108691/g.306306 Transcript_108691/m.306306 type:complete len:153 (+) Transcript_108691:55-513(+)
MPGAQRFATPDVVPRSSASSWRDGRRLWHSDNDPWQHDIPHVMRLDRARERASQRLPPHIPMIRATLDWCHGTQHAVAEDFQDVVPNITQPLRPALVARRGLTIAASAALTPAKEFVPGYSAFVPGRGDGTFGLGCTTSGLRAAATARPRIR